MTAYYAHSENKANTKHLLQNHLVSVGRLIKQFTKDVSWSDEATLCGLIHDLGKYGDLFQARLRGEVSGLDHWSLGAWLAITRHAFAAALAIQGHHIGLQKGTRNSLEGIHPDRLIQQHPLGLKLSENNLSQLTSRFEAEGLSISKPANVVIDPERGFQNPLATMLDVRILFSCLVDADFLDTEAHFEGDDNGKKFREPSPPLNPKEALEALDLFMNHRIRKSKDADPMVQQSRDRLWQMVTSSSIRNPGLFTLTAPTGSGKTLAMLKFALEHAARHGLKKIVLAVPYLSIIEQTAAIYKAVFQSFPTNYVLEHHSLAGLGNESENGGSESDEERARRLSAQNWDAPLIITTNVQLLESLFSNRPSACRKLHNLLYSLIMFDEAQTMPQKLVVPTLAALSHLSRSYSSTVLFATATQPAFGVLGGTVGKLVDSGWSAVEAAPDHGELYDKLRRYTVEWPESGEKKSWGKLAEEIRTEKQALCVVNLKKHAETLLDELRGADSLYYLSTNLCALHRRVVLENVRIRLNSKESCRLVSTQCVEAGVDIDFPVVFRALAPLDSIAQAAGRCNREGALTDEKGNRMMGELRVFETDNTEGGGRNYPTQAYYQAAEVTRSMLIKAGKRGIDLNDPSVFHDYYRRLYDLSKPGNQAKSLAEAINAVDFVNVAKEYRIIDQAAIQVLVPYGPLIDRFNHLDSQQDEAGINAQWIRQAQGLSVSIFKPRDDHPAWEVLIPAKLRFGKGVSDEWFILQDRGGKFYDDDMGLRLPQAQQLLIG